MRSSLLHVGILSIVGTAFAAGCGASSEDAGARGGSRVVVQNDPGGEEAPPATGTGPTSGTGAGSPETHDGGAPDASGPPDAGPTGCNLPPAYVATLPDPVLRKGGVSYGPGGPSSGIYFRATTTSHAKPTSAPENLLYVEKGVVLGGPSNELGPTGYRPIGGCAPSSNLVSCSADELFSVFGSEHAGSDFRIAALTQTHNPKFGYGGFELVQIDPVTGATTRFGRYAVGAPGGGTDTTTAPPPSEPPIVVATGIAAHGDDVVVVGTSNVSFAGEYGTGSYFFMYFGGFLAPTCDGSALDASSIARGTVPFVP